jgi:hypothetical protein
MKKIIFILLLFYFNSITFCQWSEQKITPTPPKLNCVDAGLPVGSPQLQFGWIGGDSGTILYTSNGGTNWYYRNNSTIGNYSVNVIALIGQPYMWSNYGALCSTTSAATTYIYRTTNQGLNWSAVYQQNSGRIRGISMANDSVVYVIGDPVGGRWTILKSTNRGVSFDSSGLYLQQNGNENSNYNSSYYSKSAYNSSITFMFGTNSSRLYRSTNSGLNWNSIIIPFQNIYSISLSKYWNYGGSGWEGYAMGNGAVYTTDYGQTWVVKTLPGTGDIHAFTFNYGDGAMYAKGSQIYHDTGTTQGFILRYTSPNGGNYTHMSIRTFAFEGVAVGGWAVKDNGTISRYAYTIAAMKKISSEVPNNYLLSQNYPNPFNPNTKFKIQIAKVSNVKVVVYDVLGKEIAILVNEQLKPGSYEVEWDGSNYPSGVYFYKLITDSFSETKRMVLIK